MKARVYLIVLFFLFGAFTAKAQTADTAKTDTQKFVAVDTPPEVLGGFYILGNYINKNIKYPKVARKNNIEGRVIVTFIVERDGSLTDMKVKRICRPKPMLRLSA